ncbi:unnamed protein product [Prunus brigantina]
MGYGVGRWLLWFGYLGGVSCGGRSVFCFQKLWFVGRGSWQPTT